MISKAHVSGKKANTKDYVAYDPLHGKFYKRKNHGNRRKNSSCRGPEVRKGWVVTGHRELFGVMEMICIIIVMVVT